MFSRSIIETPGSITDVLRSIIDSSGSIIDELRSINDTPVACIINLC
jgi:hypothetical protein